MAKFTLSDHMNKDSIHLLQGLKVTREQLLSVVTKISDDALIKTYNGSPTIAHYLLHIAQKELWWMKNVVKGEELSEEDKQKFYFAEGKQLTIPPNQGRSWYLARLADVRAITKDYYSNISDVEYHRAQCELRDEDGVKIYSPEWILYHLIDHESYYRGQIALLLSMIKGESVEGLTLDEI